MASGDLFRAFTVRFSYKKEQHVRMLQKFEDNRLNGGKTKNQVVMDALEMYFDALEKKDESGASAELTLGYLEKRLSDMEESIRGKLLQEIVGIILGSAIREKRSILSESYRKPEIEEFSKYEETADISRMHDIMDKVMDWSES